MNEILGFRLPVQSAVYRARPPRLVNPPGVWRPRWEFPVGQWITDGSNVQVVVRAGKSGVFAPTWKKAVGEKTEESLWRPLQKYQVGDMISDGNSFELAVKAGKSGASEPNWTVSEGETTDDGTDDATDDGTVVGKVVWRNVGHPPGKETLEWENIGPRLFVLLKERVKPVGLFQFAPAIDTPAKDPVTGNVVVNLRDLPSDQDIRNPGTLAPEGCTAKFGPDPSDPAGFSPQVDSGPAVCQILSAYAVARCQRAGKYF
jgi:hypothetical protein